VSAKEHPSAADKRAVNGPSFRFRLERVRALRERKEKLAQQELASSLSRLSDTRDQLHCADAELERARAEQRSAATAPGTVGAEELRSRQAFLERVEQRRSEHVQDMSVGEADVAERNAELVVAAGEHEMLKRLRTRRRSEHERETAQRENKALDEMAAMRTRRSLA
jgi:flagellar export protein FliJ